MITIEIDDAAATQALGRAISLLGDTTPMMRKISEVMAEAVEDNFDREQTPDGLPWEPLKPSTIKAREKRGYWPSKILQRRAELVRSIAREFGRDYAQVGTNKEYAAIHQFGGDIEIAARSQQLYFKQGKDGSIGQRFVRKSKSNFAQWGTIGAHTIHIPARPYLGLGPAARQAIADAAAKAIRAALAGQSA